MNARDPVEFQRWQAADQNATQLQLAISSLPPVEPDQTLAKRTLTSQYFMSEKLSNFKMGSAILIIGGLIAAGAGWNKSNKLDALEQEGIQTEAVIDKATVTERIGRRSGTKNRVDVTYKTKEGRKISNSIEVSSTFMKSISEGDAIKMDSIPLIYSEEDPSNAMLPGNDLGRHGVGMMLGLSGIGVIGFLISMAMSAPTKPKRQGSRA